MRDHVDEKSRFARPIDHYSGKEPLVKGSTTQKPVVLDKNSWQSNGTWHDRIIALLFLGHLVYVLVLAYEGIIAAQNWGYTSTSSSSSTSMAPEKPISVAAIDVEISVAMALFAVFISICWTNMLIRFAFYVMMASVFIVVALLATCMYFAFTNYNIFAGAIASFFFVALLLFVFFQKKQIVFAAVNLKIASVALYDNLSLMLVPFFMAACQLVWSIIYTLAALGAATEYMSDDQTTHEFLDENYSATTVDTKTRSHWYWLVMFLSFLWTKQVFSGIVLVTSAGVLGRWWYSGISHSSPDENLVFPAFISACTKNLGSIAFGSLLNSIAETLLFVTRKIHKSLAALVEPVQHILAYFNRFAFCCIGIYGVGFIAAGSKVLKMFKECGLTTLVNDVLLSTCLTLSSSFVGALVCGFSMWWTEPVLEFFGVQYEDTVYGKRDNGSVITWVGFIGFILGYTISSLFFRTIGGLSDATIVCFVENPHALQHNHPEEYVKAHDAWAKIYPHYTARLQSSKMGMVVLSV